MHRHSHDNQVFPPTLTTTRLDDSMDGAFQLWDDLLHRLTAHQRDFLSTLVVRMLTLLIEPAEYLDTSQDPLREALFHWLAHIFTADGWSHSRGLRGKAVARLRSELAGKCITTPVYWAQRLALVLVEEGDREFQKEWRPVVEASLFIRDGKVVMPGKHADGSGFQAPPVVFGEVSAVGMSKLKLKPTESVEKADSILSGASSKPIRQTPTSGSPSQEQNATDITMGGSPHSSRRPSVVFGEPSAPGQYTPEHPTAGQALTGGLAIHSLTTSSAEAGAVVTADESMRDRPSEVPAMGWRRPPGVWRPKPIGLIDLPGDDKYR